jgi:RNA polymerase-binding transcription factor DksA
MNERISASEFTDFKRKLRARSDVLRAEIREVLLRSDSEKYADIAGQVHDAEEEALADLLVDVSLAEITRDVGEMRDIDAALRRIATGGYGTCVRCREPISRARLEVYPTAKRCLSCQQIHDRERGVARPPTL